MPTQGTVLKVGAHKCCVGSNHSTLWAAIHSSPLGEYSLHFGCHLMRVIIPGKFVVYTKVFECFHPLKIVVIYGVLKSVCAGGPCA